MAFEPRQILKWYGEGRLPLPYTLHAVFDTAKTGDWQEMKQKKKKEEKEDKKKDDHAPSNAKITAVLNKTGDWSGNFSYFIRSGEGKSRANEVYNKISNNVTVIYGRNRPALVKFFKDYFKLDSVACNFNTKSKRKSAGKTINPGQNKPYVWEAHHMIPGDAFTQVKAGVRGSSPIFNAKQYRLMLMSDYDVNSGHNLIALPTNRMDFFQPVHDLIQHPSNHNNYTSRVVKEMKEIAKSLNKLTSDLEKPHPEISVKIAKDLEGLEDDLWDLLVKLGKASVTAIVTGQQLKLSQEDQQMLKFQNQDGSTKYPLLALG